MLSSDFIFTVCQLGAEAALKREIAREHPEFKFAYSRPGFVTFKASQGNVPMDFSLKSVFARAYGLSLGEVIEISQVQELGRKLKEQGYSVVLHVWERDFFPPGESPPDFKRGALSETFLKQVEKQGVFETFEKARTGDAVVDVVVLESNKAWLGVHIQGSNHSPWPGGQPPLLLPKEAPSRAYLKLEEALLWSEAPIRKGDWAVEIGSAPGGASFSLLNHGLNVIGIDPGEMASHILKHSQFKHIQGTVNSVLREDLPKVIHWLLLDMNVQPQVSLFAVDRLASRMKDSLLGVILTLKLNQWKLAEEIPHMIEHIRAMGMVKIKTAQLSHNRQEFVVYGLTRKGLMRSP